MNKKNNIIITILIMIAMIEISSATSYDYISYRSVYGEGTCATCHVSASGNSIMNDYGNLFKNQINYINDPIASLKNIGRNLNSPINDPRITCIGEGVDIKCTFDSTPSPISMITPRLYIDIINSQLTPDIATVINGTILVFTNKDNIINEIKGTLPMKNGIGGFDAILSVPYIINTNDITGTMDVYIVNNPNIHGKYTIVQSTSTQPTYTQPPPVVTTPGAVGPQGPKGDTGASGTDGAPGKDGLNGDMTLLNDTILQLNNTVTEQREEIAQLQNTVVQLNKMVSRLNNTIAKNTNLLDKIILWIKEEFHINLRTCSIQNIKNERCSQE